MSDISNPDNLETLINSYLCRRLERDEISGLAVAFLSRGMPAKLWCLGQANVEHNVPVCEKTVFKLGSLSKHILAVGIMLLVQEGKISLADPISAHLEHVPSGWEPITIEMLLNHTSGLRRDLANERPFALRSLSQTFCDTDNHELISSPGSAFHYSNLGYFVLGYLIEVVVKSSLQSFFQSVLFDRLAMWGTRTTSPSDIIPHRASSYHLRGSTLLNAGDLRQFRPSGAFLSTIEDMIIWDRALRGNCLLTADSMERMVKLPELAGGQTSPYGLGLYISNGRNGRILFHGGGLWSFRTYYLCAIDAGVSLVVLSNSRHADVASITADILRLASPSVESDWKVTILPET
ncbi:hypothetical protein CO659_22740 [Rhizobium sp. S9]|uniref:serine hydrolase domain-containing protein n=1 Tax=Rhizobium sp. S9 TaxID=2035454 RepID=UPI000BE91CB8|nr:serine hydrolase domain-containing protein [Rhizobium sp. S9]PDS95463.1 hypothetical protein CO659_22740 [Rhizobium sp. S9]